jgi:hypothetical protein
MNASTISTTTFALRDQDQAVVSGAVTYDAGNMRATFTPSASLQNEIVYTIAATSGMTDVTGNALVPFSASFTTVASAGSADTTPPTVISSLPASGATNVAIDVPLTVTFSEPMDGTTLTTSTMTLYLSSSFVPVPGIVTYNVGTNTAAFYPNAPLSYFTGYTLWISPGAKDLAGNGLTTTVGVAIITMQQPDPTVPAVSNVSPSNNAVDVLVDTKVVVTFNKPMNASTINSSTFTVTPPGGSPVAASVSYDDVANKATLSPSSQLAFNMAYTVNVSSGVEDITSNGLTAFTSTFTTVKDPDADLPTIISSVPANGATNVAANEPLSVTFSEAMDPATVTTASISLRVTASSANVAGAVTYNTGSNTATFIPSSQLAYSTKYTWDILGSASNLAGRRIANTAIIFTTMADPTPPTVVSVSPSDGATGVSVSTSVSILFKGPMNSSTINSSTILIAPNGGSAIPATVTFNASSNIATLTPSTALNNATTYRLAITTGVQGSNNVSLASQVNTAFTTVAIDPGNLTTIVLNSFCTLPGFFAYRNDGGAWTRVPPSNGSFTFMATPKVAITFATGVSLETYYTSSDELKAVTNMGCRATTGTKTLKGSFVNLGPTAPSGDKSYGWIKADGAGAVSSGAFTLANVPDRAVDLLAVDYAYASDSFPPFPPAKAIIRRNALLPSGSTMSAFDFASSEAIPFQTNQLNVVGGLSNDWNYLIMEFTTANGSHQSWADAEAYQGAARTFHDVPASILVDGDLHKLSFYGDANDFASARSVITYFRQPSDKTVVLGPKLNRPTITTVATSPYLRIRATLASQAEYGSAVRLEYAQDDFGGVNTTSWIVTGTAGYFGGTPSTWDLEIPDLSAVPGFPSGIGFVPSQTTYVTASAWGDLLGVYVFSGRAPRDGDVVKYASWKLPNISGQP